MFKVKSLPARFGDALLIEYGDMRSPHRVLIDGGTGGTREDIKAVLPAGQRHLELLVISHIDRDHIEGVLTLLEQNDFDIVIEDLWFNGWCHLPQNPDDEIFGAVQGERLSKCIIDQHLPWNKAFDGKAIMMADDAATLPQIVLPGGLKITLLSPTRQALADLKPEWDKELREANLAPTFPVPPNDEGDKDGKDGEETFGVPERPDVAALSETVFKRDRSQANASSIAFIAEFEGRRALFAADAHADKLLTALNLLSPQARVVLDLFKISHHGSEGTTNLDLINKVDCPTYLISTNGSIYKHPHWEAVARVLVAGGSEKTLVFNYRSESNEIWDDEALKQKQKYKTRYPADNTHGIEIDLS